MNIAISLVVLQDQLRLHIISQYEEQERDWKHQLQEA